MVTYSGLGVMAARGMLENPAMYAGYSNTPVQVCTNCTLQVYVQCAFYKYTTELSINNN